MATIQATRSAHIESKKWTWANMATGDTILPVQAERQEALGGNIQFSGTFGGATAILQASNDGTNWITLTDVHNTSISTTSPAMFEFSTGALYIRPAVSGGSGSAVTATVVLRG